MNRLSVEAAGTFWVPAGERPAAFQDQPPLQRRSLQSEADVPVGPMTGAESPSLSESWDGVPHRSRLVVMLGIVLLGLVGMAGVIAREAWHGRLAGHAMAL